MSPLPLPPDFKENTAATQAQAGTQTQQNSYFLIYTFYVRSFSAEDMSCAYSTRVYIYCLVCERALLDHATYLQ